MTNYKYRINYKIKIKQKTCDNFFFSYNSITTRVLRKDLTHILCLQYLIS